MKKAYFFPRITAYVIDILIISLISAICTFLIPTDANIHKLNEEYTQLQVDYLDKKVDQEVYAARSVDLVYDLDYANALTLMIQVAIIIVYFMVFQFYNKGQTFGKKLMKVRVVAEDEGELMMNHFVYRSLLIHAVLVNVVTLGFLLFMNKDGYYYTSVGLQFIQMILVLACILMVSFRKDGRGLHDMLGRTKVVMVD